MRWGLGPIVRWFLGLVVWTLGFSCGTGARGEPGDAAREIAIIISSVDLANPAKPDRESSTESEPASDPARPDESEWIHEDVFVSVPETAFESDDRGPAPPDLADETCVPDCTGRVCGNDGCGGSCGTCHQANQVCQSGQCVCIPNCSGRECGPDGCGGACAPGCAAGVPCLETGTCAKSGPCSKHATLECTGEYSTSSNNNGFPPNSDVLDQYSCDSTLAHGPEKVYRFVPDQTGQIALVLQGAILPDPPDFLNLYLLVDNGVGCTSASCIAFGHKELVGTVEAKRTYYVVVDAVSNKTASYYLTLSCSWASATSE